MPRKWFLHAKRLHLKRSDKNVGADKLLGYSEARRKQANWTSVGGLAPIQFAVGNVLAIDFTYLNFAS